MRNVEAEHLTRNSKGHLAQYTFGSPNWLFLSRDLYCGTPLSGSIEYEIFIYISILGLSIFALRRGLQAAQETITTTVTPFFCARFLRLALSVI